MCTAIDSSIVERQTELVDESQTTVRCNGNAKDHHQHRDNLKETSAKVKGTVYESAH